MASNLQGRVAAQRAGNGTAAGSEVERRPATLEAQIERMMPEFEKALPRGLEAIQIVRDGVTCLRTTPKLAQCEPASVLGALMTCAQLGLRPGVLGHAWPVPFWEKAAGAHKAQLIIGYKGYIELGFRSGRITAWTARTVFAEDEFRIAFYQDRDEMVHAPCVDDLPGEIRCFYSTARLKDGGYSLTRPMSLKSMQAYRDKHARRDSTGNITGPWSTDFEPMGLKTMVRINAKLLPMSPELAIAIDADEGVRIDLNPEANAAEVTEHPVVEGRVEPDSPEERQEASGQ